jgi:hypothetical protein
MYHDSRFHATASCLSAMLGYPILHNPQHAVAKTISATLTDGEYRLQSADKQRVREKINRELLRIWCTYVRRKWSKPKQTRPNFSFPRRGGEANTEEELVVLATENIHFLESADKGPRNTHIRLLWTANLFRNNTI